MNIGKRKAAAGVGLLALAAIAVGAYLIAGTDGLLVVTLAVVAVSTAVLGWFVANSERRLRRLIDEVNHTQSKMIRERFDGQGTQLDRALTNEQAEQLLRAIRSGFLRAEGEWEQSRAELLSALRTGLDHEANAIGREIAAMGHEVRAAGHEVAAVGRDAAASNQRIVGLTDQIDRTAADLRSIAEAAAAGEMTPQTREQIGATFRRLIDEAVSEMDALLQLRGRYPVSGKPPVLGGWAIGSGAILSVLETIEEHDVDLVVECGPGASTVYIAELLRRRGRGRVIGLEHDPEFHAIVQRDIEARGLSEFADVRLAPLVDVEIADRVHPWYDPSSWEDVDGIGLLLVDGPPKKTAEMARFPALPLLESRLGPEAVVVVDDAHRADEQAAIAAWQEMCGWEPAMTPPGGFAALHRRPGADRTAHGGATNRPPCD